MSDRPYPKPQEDSEQGHAEEWAMEIYRLIEGWDEKSGDNVLQAYRDYLTGKAVREMAETK